jgi:phospholipid-binding lipoprotein MlaA
MAAALAAAVPVRPVWAQGAAGDTVAETEDAWDEDWEGDGEGGAVVVSDPIQPWNRAMFVFNDRLYFWVLKPVARGYAFVVPQTVRRGVSNFFYNIAAPIRIVNSALQGKGNRMGIEIGRFCINILEGGLGFGNAADNYPELASSPEDTGQTLGHYGVGDGFYIVWPLLGPSTLRDSVGRVGDFFLDPVRYVDPMEARLGLRAYEQVNNVSLRIGDYEALKAAAISPYDALKDAYIQNRRRLVLE